jgi:HSP20 family protein
MSVRDLLPWRRKNGDQLPGLFRDDERDPFLALHREVNRLFDETFRNFGISPFRNGPEGGWPSLEISDDEKEIRIAAEVPGMNEKDIEVLLSDGMLTLKGEKRSETEDKDKQYSERYYGRFERRIPLDCEVDAEKVEASFKNGVLTVTLPKSEQEKARVRRISVRS